MGVGVGVRVGVRLGVRLGVRVPRRCGCACACACVCVCVVCACVGASGVLKPTDLKPLKHLEPTGFLENPTGKKKSYKILLKSYEKP